MANKSKAKGTSAETEVVKYLQQHGIEASRKALHGSQDLADVEISMDDGIHRSLEIKAGKQTATPSRAMLDEWGKQTVAESLNCGHPVYLVVRRFRRKIQDCDVWLVPCIHSPYEFWTHLYLDEFVKQLKEGNV